MTIARRRRVVLFTAGLAGLFLAAGCTGDGDDPVLQSLPFEVGTASTAPPGSDQSGGSTVSAAVDATYLGSYSVADDGLGTDVTVTVGQGLRMIESNALPNHDTGAFPNPGNPNTIVAQSLRFEFSTNPQHLDRATPVRIPGVAINGVPFEPGTAEVIQCDSGQSYRIEAIQGLHDLGLDANRANVQPNGTYHYHGLPAPLAGALGGPDSASTEALTEAPTEAPTEAATEAATDDGASLTHVGFAADGFLMAISTDAAHQPSYRLATEPRVGTGCLYRGEEVSIDGTTPDGTYVSDWVNDPAVGQLDACNGTTVGDEYLYLVTEAYPYVSRCLMGDVNESGPGADGAGPGGAGPTGDGSDRDDDEPDQG